MTPQLQQAIKLLQMSNLELQGFVAQELERNPLLSLDEAEPAPPPEPRIEAAGPALEARLTREGVASKRIGKPGVFTWPSVGWSYSTKLPLCLTCGSSTRSW